MKHTLINVALFAGILAVMVGVQVVDATDNGPEHAVAKEEAAKQAREERFAKAAQEICGENAGYAITKGNVLVCKTKRGHKTGKVASL